MSRHGWKLFLATPMLALTGLALAFAADQPQWGSRHSRNMVSAETGLPSEWDLKTGKNVLWIASLGDNCFSTPVVAQGRVLIGTNNEKPRDPKHQGDRGTLYCFREADGAFLWQLVSPKLSEDIYFDWPKAGMCSPPTIEGDRVYTVTNRDEVVCLDLFGMANGNDGPFRDEGRLMAPADKPALTPGPTDADILWRLDLRAEAGVRPHDSSHCSILLDGPYLYVNTSNGLTSRHDGVDKPEAPSLLVVDKSTGKILARENEGIGPNIFHAAWSSPAMGVAAGKKMLVYGGADGVVYGFEPYPAVRSANAAAANGLPSLSRIWRFDCDPQAPKTNVHRFISNRKEGPSFISGMPVLVDGKVYVAAGGDIWWGKRQAWLHCIDASGQGDVTSSHRVWSYPVEKHCCSTPAIHEGLAYIADCAGKLHCVDIQTGKACWVHDCKGEIWSSPLVADGKVHVGTRKGLFWILEAGRAKREISSSQLDSAVISTPVAANRTLYLGTMNKLYALRQNAQSRPETTSAATRSE